MYDAQREQPTWHYHPRCRTGSPRTISNLSSSPSSKSATCSDRFIPCRSSSRLHTFGLVEKASPVKGGGGGGNNDAYSRLLKSELFGTDFGCFSSPCRFSKGGSPMSPSKNMLRFKTENSGPNSPYSPSVLGHTDTSLSNGVLDAPALQDDFYLNLVDWSSQNVLAVGLGTCVYLWTASNSRVTKLWNLGPTDSVCSSQWTREGSYISIGTSLGQVQVLGWNSMQEG
ncbi:Protein FIZZY-RELATED 2 [Datura stramonium]|uniref:Protein FIZZY-RELATED 2 n=1 Tax=Datura stramonium TaxID=4076 RepID=A0ABS8SG28_DATST|nr:Protein FIZZY-RELATED 2 [Datura stramonium]